MFLKFSTAASMFILAIAEAQLNIPDVIDADKPAEPESTSDVQPNPDNEINLDLDTAEKTTIAACWFNDPELLEKREFDGEF